jgi:uncharacterized protein DUF6868
MDRDVTRKVLFWCGVVNYGVLLVWFLVFMFAHEWIYLLHTRWFHLSVEQFDVLHYAGMSIFKVGILLLNVAPCFGLHITRGI